MSLPDPVGERSEQEGRRIEMSDEGIPLVFGDGKYPHDPPRVASDFEAELYAERDQAREALRTAREALEAISDVQREGGVRALGAIKHLTKRALVALALAEARHEGENG